MTGHCIEKLPHINCPNNSSDGLQVFDDDGKITGYCFSCGSYVANPYADGNAPKKKRIQKTDEELAREVEEVASLSSAELTHRKLQAWALEHFGVKVAVSEQDGITPVAYYYPCETDGQLVNWKAKTINEGYYFRVGPKGDTDPFGWRQALAAGSPKLFITEGEDDAIALYQSLKLHAANTKWAHLEPAVISLRNGATGAKADINKYFSVITKVFRDVVLVFDMDEPGRKAVKDVVQILPSASTAILPSKDANACVMDGYTKALCTAVLHQASTPKNTRLILASSLFEEAKKPPEWGYSWPWPTLTDLTRGIRLGETCFIGAGVKMGKTEMRNSIAEHLIREHKMKVMMAALEEANLKTVKLMVGKAARSHFHDPKRGFDETKFGEGTKVIGDNLFLVDLYQQTNWETLRADIISAAQEGCQAIFIDPITNVINGLSASETDTVLKEIAPELSAMARDHGLAVFIFCHLKAPLHGEPHERGGKVYSSQFAGSRAMMRSCNYMIGIEGNKDPALDPEQRNIRHFIILEDREFGMVGDIPVYWDENTGIFTEMKQ
jgi:twinkle protein